MGINNNISITQLSPKMQEILNSYASKVTDKVKVLAKETAVDLTKSTKKDSPKDTGEFKRHITYKKTRETSTSAVYTWYVKDPEYRLTHLIAKGHRHVVGSGKGNKIPLEVGRIEGNFPLAEDVIEAENKFVKGVKEIIENEC
jgi:hypothetical protein